MPELRGQGSSPAARQTSHLTLPLSQVKCTSHFSNLHFSPYLPNTVPTPLLSNWIRIRKDKTNPGKPSEIISTQENLYCKECDTEVE
jgi:hypothetical protein